jgi:hypothetical protein
VSGTYAAGSIVDISALNSDGELISVGMDFITTDGIGYVSGTIGDAVVIVKRWCRYHVLRPFPTSADSEFEDCQSITRRRRRTRNLVSDRKPIGQQSDDSKSRG